MTQIKAPFTPEQVAALQNYQDADHFHPFTCGNRENHPPELYRLTPTVRGWICQFCDYTQDWAHDFMAQPLPPDPTDALLEEIRGNVKYAWHVVLHIEGRAEDFEVTVVESDVKIALFSAIIKAALKESELIHQIHVSPPRQAGRA